MPPLRLLSSCLSIVATAALLASCGGGGGNSGSATQSASAGSGSSHASGSSGGSGDAVSIRNFKFSPGTLTVKSGTKVTVTNNDSTAHTATSDDGSSFDTGDIDPGSSKTITLSKAGTVKYHCSIHPFMHGTIVVQ
ncbi:MAG TPA: cupredoxin family copper-binding protein [Candidatus Dormibacteraeota bacterium]|nr:cupredoxin family copper-binding protein [Candidatus Dormibacteraeota bacterium]